MSNIRKVGFVGLGIMGKPMAKNLIHAGFEMLVHDRLRPRADEVAIAGATAVDSSSAAASGADAIVTMLPDGPDSESVILGEAGVLDDAKPGSVIIDMSSISPMVSRKIALACEARRVNFLDAPVSGGEPMAISGDLAIMVGGKQDVFDRVETLFRTLGESWVLCGDYGAGSTTKLVNQIIVAANLEAVAEGLILAKKAGLDLQKVFDAIKGGSAGSTVLNSKASAMIAGDFAPGFRIRLHNKDLRNVLSTAAELSLDLPVTAIVQQMFESLVNDGKGDEDHSSIANLIETMTKTAIP